jgi:hypothetical protein
MQNSQTPAEQKWRLKQTPYNLRETTTIAADTARRYTASVGEAADAESDG